MFRLLRYFSITSLISIAIASVALGVFYRHMAIRNLLELGEDHNIDMTRAFANTLWPQLAPVVKESLEIPPDHLRGLPQIPALHDAVYAQATKSNLPDGFQRGKQWQLQNMEKSTRVCNLLHGLNAARITWAEEPVSLLLMLQTWAPLLQEASPAESGSQQTMAHRGD